MTPAEIADGLEWAEKYKDLDDPMDPYPSDVVGRFARLALHLHASTATLREELEAWQNCAICIDCGRGKVDEDGCCATCGRDCLLFEYGKLVDTGVAHHLDSFYTLWQTATDLHQSAIAERDSARAELARCRRLAEWAMRWQSTMRFECSRAPGEVFTCEQNLLDAIDAYRAGNDGGES